MGLLPTRIKDKDLLNIFLAIKEVQRRRNNIHKDPIVLAEGYTTGGNRRDTYSEVVSNVKKWMNEDLAKKLEAAAKKLRK